MKIAKKGADSHSRFKSDVANPDSLAAEIVSLLNADGGTIYLGISDNGDISCHSPSEFLFPQFCVKAVRLNGNSLAAESYDDSEDYAGTLSSIYSGVTAFVARNLHKRQTSAGVNAPGQSEIHPAVVEEVLVNALLHRDYFVDAPIRVLIFDDRMEVVSPGSLPNHLTVEKILAGNTNIRNPILASFVAKGMLPYHGLGSGIMRAKSLCPDIHFEDDKSGVQFKVVIPRGQVAMTTIGRKELVFDALRENPTLPLRSLAKNMNMSLSTIQEYVGALKAEGRLVREGGTRGKWRCVK